MHRIAQLNVVCNGSTGRIMKDLQREALNNEFEVKVFYGRRKAMDKLDSVKFSNFISFFIHMFITFLFNKHGHGSYLPTKRLIKKLKKFNPDIIHIHNIHGYYLNYPVLFSYLEKDFKGKIIWTLHDCWPYTGHCSHYAAVGCRKWETGCNNCPQKFDYPYSWFFDTSESEYILKKKYFTSVNSLCIVTPSHWMKTMAQKSFLNKYDIKVIQNWIDLDRFVPCYDSAVYGKYNIPENKKILLSVSNIWTNKKGLDKLMELSSQIDDNYCMVLVGLNSYQINKLPDGVIGIRRTDNVKELINLYSISYVLINASLEESFSLVTVEAMACNTPVIALNSTALPELISDENGILITENEIGCYLNAINKVGCITRKDNAIRKTVEKFNKRVLIKQYIDLYNQCKRLERR